MSQPSPTSQIDQYLRVGRPQDALKAAIELCRASGATREIGIEIARTAAAVYRDMITPPVMVFTEEAPKILPPEVGLLVQKALQRLFKMTEEWEKRLWEIHTERLVRELRDWVRSRHLEAAAANVARLMALVPKEQAERRAMYIGNVLATVLNNPREAQELLNLLAKNPQQYYLTIHHVGKMEEARQKRSGQMVGINIDNLEREYTSVLTQAVVDIKNTLPDSTKMDEPDEAVLRDAGDLFRSIFRVPILRQEPELFLDATNVCVEFIPKEQSQTSKLAKLEARAYGSLGYTAKKVVLLTLQDMGRIKLFTTVYKGWAENYLGTDSLRPIVEVMGALRTPDFADFLTKLQGDKRQAEIVGGQLATAMGSMAGEEAADMLMGQLRDIFARKRMETADIREAERAISGLGNIVKSPRTDDGDRMKVVEYLRTHVPEDLTRLAMYAALQAFTSKIDKQTTQQRQWAIRVLAKALWLPDQSTAHQKGGDRQASELGFRHEITEALIKIAAKDPHTLIRAVDPLAARYSAAYMAAAEAFEKIGHEEALPLLERMLNTVLLHDDNAQSAYQAEYYWDATAQERKKITKAKLLGPIIHAVGSIGGESGKQILMRYQQQISIGKVAPPTPEVAGYLQKFMGADALAGAAQIAERESVAASPEEIQELVKALQARYFLSSSTTRRMKKIESLTQLARIAAPETIDVVMTQLGDKDAMVVSATIVCLAEFAQPYQPKAVREITINATLDQFENKDPAVRQGALKLIKEIGPNRKDVRDKILAFMKLTERREVKEALAIALKTGGGSPLATSGSLSKSGAELKPEGAAMDAMTKLELKKEYMAKRKAWIDGGKKGDPPVKPPGVD